MSEMKIVQVMPMANDATYQGALWGLRSDGVICEYRGCAWNPIVPNEFTDCNDQNLARIAEFQREANNLRYHLSMISKLSLSDGDVNAYLDDIDIDKVLGGFDADENKLLEQSK